MVEVPEAVQLYEDGLIDADQYSFLISHTSPVKKQHVTRLPNLIPTFERNGTLEKLLWVYVHASANCACITVNSAALAADAKMEQAQRASDEAEQRQAVRIGAPGHELAAANPQTNDAKADPPRRHRGFRQQSMKARSERAPWRALPRRRGRLLRCSACRLLLRPQQLIHRTATRR